MTTDQKNRCHAITHTSAAAAGAGNKDNPMNKKTFANVNVALTAIVGVFCMCADASPLAIPVKAVVEKIAAKSAGRAAATAVGRGSAALAAVNAERAVARSVSGRAIGDVVKNVSSKQILAGGGATALVVGAHEVADGFQKMEEGVAETLKVDPDAVGPVVSAIMAPVRWAAVGIVAAAMSILLWFIWPWITLLRNWSKLHAAKRAAKMRQEGYADARHSAERNTPDSAPVEGEVVAADYSMQSGKIERRTLFAIGLFSVLAAVSIIGLPFNGKSLPPWAAERNAENKKIERRERVMEELRAGYLSSVKRLHENFRKEVAGIAQSEFASVRASIPAVADKFGGFSRCKDLFKDMVIDKIKGGNRVEKSINANLEQEYYNSLYAARDKVVASLEELVLNLDAVRKEYRFSMEKELALECLPGDESYEKHLKEYSAKIEEKKLALKSAQNVAAITTAIEVLLVRQTVAAVSRLLGRAVVRQVAALGTGAVAAIVDGPLPVGDIIGGLIAIGGLGFAAHDIYNATKVLPMELRKALTETTDACEKECLREVLDLGQKMSSAYSSLAGKQ